jgi:hypothetical protein
MRQDTEELINAAKKSQGLGVLESEANNVLFVEGLSRVTQTNVLNNLFQTYPGFREIRHIAEKNVAFVEFDNED